MVSRKGILNRSLTNFGYYIILVSIILTVKPLCRDFNAATYVAKVHAEI